MSVANLKIASVPYTYILEWVKEGKRYIGARWAKGCHPSDLWSEYFTSSKYVHDYVAQNGKPDIILIDRTFDIAQEAMQREQELQYKYNVRDNENFLNKNMFGIWNPSDTDIHKKIGDSNRGRKMSPENAAKCRIAHLGKKHSEDTKKRMAESHKGNKSKSGQKISEETKKKMSETHKRLKSHLRSCRYHSAIM